MASTHVPDEAITPARQVGNAYVQRFIARANVCGLEVGQEADLVVTPEVAACAANHTLLPQCEDGGYRLPPAPVRVGGCCG